MKIVPVLACALALSSLLGCSGSFNADSPAASSFTRGVAIQGVAKGGQQPLTGSHIYLFAASNTGYGAASSSLLNLTGPGVLTDSSGKGYVVSGTGGNFSITGDWSCINATDQVYVLAVGGNPGLAAGTNNTAIDMIDALGTCSAITSSTFVIINEATTVAAATALSQFSVDPMHIGTSAGNPTGLANAFVTANNLVDIAGVSARAKTRAGNGIVPTATINTLANIMSTCVNTATNASTQCVSYFLDSTVTGTLTLPGNTFNAALSIAQNANNNAYTLFSLAPASGAPFQPALASQPNDWSIGIAYDINTNPNFIAIDAAGDVWASATNTFGVTGRTDAIVKLGPDGTLLSGSGFTQNGFIRRPQGIAIDDSGRVWVAIATNGLVTRLNNDGTPSTGFTPAPPAIAAGVQGIALNKLGTAYISVDGNSGAGNTLAAIDSSGNILSLGFSLGAVYDPQGVAVDSQSNVWVAGQGSDNLAKYYTSIISSGGGLHAPTGVAIDATNRVWAVDSYNYGGQVNLSVFNTDGSAVTGNPGYGFGNTMTGIANIVAIDGANSAWTAVCGNNCIGFNLADQVDHFSSTGTLLNTRTDTLATLNSTIGFVNPTFSGPQPVAIDASGNLWTGNALSTTITQLVGVAAPVKTPLQSALKSTLIGKLP